MCRPAKHLPPLNEARRQLVERNLDLVGKIVNSRLRRHPAKEEFYSAGCFGLCKAGQRFAGPDTEGDAAFRGYAYAMVWGAMLDAMREHRPKGFRFSRREHRRPEVLSLAASADGIENYRYCTTTPDNRQTTLEADDLADGLARMMPRHADVIRGLCAGREQQELAAEMGISPSLLSYRVRSIIRPTVLRALARRESA